MLNKKIILSVLIIGVVGTLAGSATWAYFDDTETSTGNTITAGTIDLLINNTQDSDMHFTLDDKDPADQGNETFALSNAGDLAGELDIEFTDVTNTNGQGSTEYESSGSGELGENAQLIVFIDDDNNKALSVGDIVLRPGTPDAYALLSIDGTTETTYFKPINDYDGKSFNAVIASLEKDHPKNIIFYWKIPGTVGNEIQGDSVSFDVTYTLEQVDAD